MKFNVEKCKVMNIGFRNPEEHYALNGATLGVAPFKGGGKRFGYYRLPKFKGW